MNAWRLPLATVSGVLVASAAIVVAAMVVDPRVTDVLAVALFSLAVICNVGLLTWGMVRLLIRCVLTARRGEGRCRECGYDLTGLSSTTCPECGRRMSG